MLKKPCTTHTHHKFVNTTPKPRATKNSSGDCVAVFPPLLDEELVADADEVSVVAGIVVDVASRATTFSTSTII